MRALADGGAVAAMTVADGRITLAAPARRIQAGLPFTHEIVPLPPAQTGGQGLPPGKAVRLVRAHFRVLDTRALYIDTGRGPTSVPFRRFGKASFDAEPPPFSGDVRVRALGWSADPMTPLWRIHQDVPLPCTVLSVATEVKLAD